MLEDGILVAEQSLTQQLKWSSELQYSTLAFIELDRWSERLILIKQLVMSSSSTCKIVLTLFFNCSSDKQVSNPILS